MIQTASMVLRNGTRLLADAIGDGAAKDARILMAKTLDVATDRLAVELSRTVTPMQVAQFEHMIKRRCKCEPISHIIGKRPFWKHEFLVTADVLDPRPETETVIDLAVAGTSAKRILDLGTGSGCILLSLLAEWPDAQGVGVDVSEAALKVAEKNAVAIGVFDRCNLHLSDWFKETDGKFDLIVSNPPYISEAEMLELSVDVREYEPHLALTPGGDGLSAYRIIAANLAAHLTENGRALFEIGFAQGESVSEVFASNGFSGIAIHKDLGGRDRVVEITKNTPK